MNTTLLLILLVIIVIAMLWYAHESSKNAHLRILHVLNDAQEPLLGRDICKAAKCWRGTICIHLAQGAILNGRLT